MTNEEHVKKMHALTLRRSILLNNLVAPARAAANALKDAGMKNTADPLAEALFELEAVDQEALEFVKQNVGAIAEMLKILGRRE